MTQKNALPEGVQESRQALHQAEDAHGQRGPEGEDGPKNDTAIPENKLIQI